MILLVPFTAFGMQVMSDAEMDAITAQYSASLEIGEERAANRYPENETPRYEAAHLFARSQNRTGSRAESMGAGAGVAVMIDDMKFFFGGSREFWYRSTGNPG